LRSRLHLPKSPQEEQEPNSQVTNIRRNNNKLERKRMANDNAVPAGVGDDDDDEDEEEEATAETQAPQPLPRQHTTCAECKCRHLCPPTGLSFRHLVQAFSAGTPLNFRVLATEWHRLGLSRFALDESCSHWENKFKTLHMRKLLLVEMVHKNLQCVQNQDGTTFDGAQQEQLMIAALYVVILSSTYYVASDRSVVGLC
jgi:hypothetical protein